MPTYTTNLHLAKPLVNNATDQDLWGGELNDNMDILDAAIPALLPLGSLIHYAGLTEPTKYLFCYGQAISRSTYADLFAVVGTTYGTGDGSTTFNLPDMRGRSLFGRDDMGGVDASRVTSAVSGIDGVTMGAAGGDQRVQTHTHTAHVTDPGHKHTIAANVNGLGAGAAVVGNLGGSTSYDSGTATTGITVVNDNYGAGSSQNMPPAFIINVIMKVLN